MLINERQRAWIETALVLLVFFIEGAFPVPEVNEPYYLGKAIHFWNPAWGAGDFFLDSADAHWVFYFSFGWLSRWIAPLGLAWVGRLLTWTLLACAWRRLSWAVVPRPGFAVLSAALLVAGVDWFHMAGEWIIGGVEAKGFAYVLVLFGLEAIVRDRWRLAWLLLGAAAAFHVIVGGWAVLVAAFVWAVGNFWEVRGLVHSSANRRRLHGQPSTENMDLTPSRGTSQLLRDRLRESLPGLIGGAGLAMLGLAPVLALNLGVDRGIVRAANEIYVFERLFHHLDPWQMPAAYVVRFVALAAVWALLCIRAPASAGAARLRLFVFGTLLVALVGGGLALISFVDRGLAASLLRFYWFRLSDVMLPLGVAIEATSLAARGWVSGNRWGRIALPLVAALAVYHVGTMASLRPIPQSPPADRLPNYSQWRDVVDWIAAADLPREARFLTPRSADTFTWYTGRASVVNWKEIPQDARAIVEWRRRLDDVYGVAGDDGTPALVEWPELLPPERILRLGRQYDFRYVVAGRQRRLPFRRLYENQHYVVYELPEPPDGYRS